MLEVWWKAHTLAYRRACSGLLQAVFEVGSVYSPKSSVGLFTSKCPRSVCLLACLALPRTVDSMARTQLSGSKSRSYGYSHNDESFPPSIKAKPQSCSTAQPYLVNDVISPETRPVSRRKAVKLHHFPKSLILQRRTLRFNPDRRRAPVDLTEMAGPVTPSYLYLVVA